MAVALVHVTLFTAHLLHAALSDQCFCQLFALTCAEMRLALRLYHAAKAGLTCSPSACWRLHGYGMVHIYQHIYAYLLNVTKQRLWMFAKAIVMWDVFRSCHAWCLAALQWAPGTTELVGCLRN